MWDKDYDGSDRGKMEKLHHSGIMHWSETSQRAASFIYRVINQQLKELEMHGIISKKIFMELPPHSEYAITELGKTLIPLIEQLEIWGDSFRPEMKRILKIE